MIRTRPQTNWRQGLVGAWSPAVQNRLIGGTGLIINDLSASGNHGTLTNMDPATDWITSNGYSALDCVTDDYVDCGNVAAGRFETGNFAFSWWGTVRSTASRMMLFAKDAASARTFTFAANEGAASHLAGAMSIAVFNNSNVWFMRYATGVFSANEFMHLGAQRTNGVMSLWKNGKQLSTTTTSGGGGTEGMAAGINTTSVTISRRAYAANEDYADVAVNEVVWWDRGIPDWLELYQLGPGGWAATRRRSASKRPGAAPPAQNNAAWWLAYQMGM